MKKLSIIIAVYNVSKYIKKCLDSVIIEKSNDIEIIIVDDGSKDKSLEICKKYANKDSRIKVIHQKNKGLSSTRNTGLMNSSGEYIWFVDGDDYLEENYYRIINEYLKNDIICFDYNEVNMGKKKYIHDKKKYCSIDERYILSFCVVWNKIIKRKVLEDVLFPDGHLCNDVYVIPSLIMKSNNIVFVNNSIYNYVFHVESLSNSKRNMLDEHIFALKHIEKEFNGKYYEELETLYINNLLFYYIVDEINKGQIYDYIKINRMIKDKFPRYYKNRFWNNNGLIRKIYIRLMYYNMFGIAKLITKINFR